MQERKNQMHIFFVGYMGSGKSSLGKRVAHELLLPFLDSDKEIEKKYNRTIPEIFSELGEAKFREIEKEFLDNLPLNEKVVISTGGGTPCFHGNMDKMNELGLTIYLKRPVKELAHRIENSKKSRPLVDHLQGEDLDEFIAEHLTERESFYSICKIIPSREDQTVKRLVEMIDTYFSSFEKK